MFSGSASSPFPSPSPLDPFLGKMLETLRQTPLFQRGDSLLLAVSGGCDSMVMMEALVALRPHLGLGEMHVVYLDHGQRPSQTPQEAALVIERAQRYGLEALALPLLIPRRASFQDAARQARRACLEDLAEKRNLTWIATGHHRDDQAETLLQRLFRGTGPRGLGGIRPKQGRFVHPLLWASRQEISLFAQKQAIPWIDDPTNETVKYQRNLIRHRLLPHLEAEYDPKIRVHLTRLASLLRADEAFFSQILSETLQPPLLRRFSEGICLDLQEWDHLPEALRWRCIQALVAEVSGQELSSIHLEHLIALMENREGEQIASLPSFLEGLRTYHRLWLFPSRPKKEDTGFSLSLRSEGEFLTPQGRLTISYLSSPPANLSFATVPPIPPETLNSSEASLPSVPLASFVSPVSPSSLSRPEISGGVPWQVFVPEKEAPPFPWLCRSRSPGDRLSDQRQLKRWMINARIPRFLRNGLPLVFFHERVVWLPGFRAWEPCQGTESRPCWKLDFQPTSALLTEEALFFLAHNRHHAEGKLP